MKILLQDRDKFRFVDTSDIIRVASMKNYIRFFFRTEQGNDRILILASLDQAEKALGDSFFRASRSELVNLDHIVSVDKGPESHYWFTMSDKEIIQCSRRQSVRFGQLFHHNRVISNITIDTDEYSEEERFSD